MRSKCCKRCCNQSSPYIAANAIAKGLLAAVVELGRDAACMWLSVDPCGDAADAADAAAAAAAAAANAAAALSSEFRCNRCSVGDTAGIGKDPL